MSSVYQLDAEKEADNLVVLEDLQQRIAGNFGVTVVGNCVTLRWHLHGELVDVHMLVASVTTPADARELARKQAEYAAIVAKTKKKYPDLDADVFHAEHGEWPC